MAEKRPNMGDYFRARIDQHVNGMMARTTARLPAGVSRVDGDVTDTTITVVMRDGTTWLWSGGQYGTRKIAGCYAPKMPTPAEPERCVYCNETGHAWTTHPEARAEAAAWERERTAAEFPFGDHRDAG